MQQKILILTAIPHGLRLDTEIREIQEAIIRSVKRNLFSTKIRTAVRPQDIRRAIAEERPKIVHFCGHGMEDGSLILEDDGGDNKLVSPEGLAALFESHKDYVKCVLLNACYSAKPAEAISQHIEYTVGMNQPIGDKAAIVFAQGFYDGLGYELSNNQDTFESAFKEGLIAIKLEDFSQANIPVLKQNKFIRKNINNTKQNPSQFKQLENKVYPLKLKPVSLINNVKSTDNNIDYTNLENFLHQGAWRDADEETLTIMLEANEWGRFSKSMNECYIDSSYVNKIPLEIIQNIDAMWLKYSDEKFGFSIQKQIWKSVGRKYDKFGLQVRWCKRSLLDFGQPKWLLYENLNFDYVDAVTGHLPARWNYKPDTILHAYMMRNYLDSNVSKFNEKVGINVLSRI
ncbi:GUN4 domain-containing protein [Nostocaceae cyanobacterium CENA357]|uniref:GUN4 domain-containing protein n=1 Tax=Atlanticothrix silvestris CENA357 TaxID=1725252 RepID=A0A8J7HK85_9CYAN|nr:GUN4 domain-containing protein [Atlanticothrix silvestris]MBH8554509.1 GUN4 domain-containing protein [Atlanticothrix silvestris CENA357]